jgi:LacI family transcriptional regulator
LVGNMLDPCYGEIAEAITRHAEAPSTMGIIDGVRRTGRSVPDDISIVGIGNTRLVEWSMPKLTHVDLNLQACGHAALDFIAASVAGEPCDRNAVPPARLVRGDSIAILR